MKFLIVLLFVCPLAYSTETIEITSPKSGWRDSTNTKIGFTQTVHYPDVKVTTPEGQADNGKIEGRIRGRIAGSDKPYTLVVNGNAMPLEVNGETFSRPYSFGRGSNSVQVLSPSRKTVAKAQFVDVSQRQFPARIRVILSWDSDGTDIDLHLITPDGQHCYYGDRNVANGTALDVDVTTGYGPEIIASPGSVKGPYHVFVNYYGRASNGLITTATITTILNEGTLDEKVERVKVPLRRPGDLIHLYSFNYE